MDENSQKNKHQLMLNIIKEKVNDLNMTALAHRVVRKKKKAGPGGSFLKLRRVAN